MSTNNYSVVRAYVDKNPIAILSTYSEDGTPHGAAVCVCAEEHSPVVYFLTKQATLKLKNLRAHPKVGLTIVNSSENSTLQASGIAREISDAQTIDAVMDKISHIHDYAKDWLPPVAKIRAGAYAVIGVELSHARLASFKDKTIGDEHIFTELQK